MESMDQNNLYSLFLKKQSEGLAAAAPNKVEGQHHSWTFGGRAPDRVKRQDHSLKFRGQGPQ